MHAAAVTGGHLQRAARCSAVKRDECFTFINSLLVAAVNTPLTYRHELLAHQASLNDCCASVMHINTPHYCSHWLARRSLYCTPATSIWNDARHVIHIRSLVIIRPLDDSWKASCFTAVLSYFTFFQTACAAPLPVKSFFYSFFVLRRIVCIV